MTNEQPRRRFQRTREFVRKRLSPQEEFGLHVTIGVLVTILGAWMFSEIAENLGPTTPEVVLDQRVANWFHTHARPELTALARALTFCGSVGFVAAVSVACAIYFVAIRGWNRLIALAVTMGGGSLLNLVLKHFFHRQRPVFENPLVTLSSFGFPSAHTMGSTLLYGLLALICVRFTKTIGARTVIVAAATLLIALIGLTRIYLGAHYLTDVLGAIAIGVAWLAFCWTTTETFRKRGGGKAR
jgi:undecaprenyl-diphosphatase